MVSVTVFLNVTVRLYPNDAALSLDTLSRLCPCVGHRGPVCEQMERNDTKCDPPEYHSVIEIAC